MLFVDSAEHRGLSVSSPRVDSGGGRGKKSRYLEGLIPCFVVMQLGIK